MSIFAITLSIDIIGTIIGIISIYVIVATKKQLGGEVGKALSGFNYGVVSMILAFVYTIIFTRLKLLAPPPVDIHHLLMVVGMILFVMSAKTFSKTIKL